MKKKWKIIYIVAGILAAFVILGAGLLYLSFDGSIVRKKSLRPLPEVSMIKNRVRVM